MIDSRWVEVRHQYGDVYITVFPNGLIVPWKALSIGEFIYYDQQIARGLIPPACLEDEVFQKCVQDQQIKDNTDTICAGVVTTVVHNIWEYSGPSTPQQLQQDLEKARLSIKESRSSILHQCASMIAAGFSYTLEQVYAMDYETFMTRLAQSEGKLLTMGVIQEPFSLNIQQPEVQTADLNQKVRSKIDAKEAWERQQSVRLRKEKKDNPHGKWWEVSPVLESDKKKKINFEQEKMSIDQLSLDTHENVEKGAMRQHIIESKLAGPRAKMIDDAKIIYKDLIENLNKSKK